MLKQLLQASPPAAAGKITAPGSIAENFSRGLSVQSGQGVSASFNSSGKADGTTGSLGDAGRAFQGIGMGLSALGVAAKDGGLAQAGGLIGTAGSVMGARNIGELGMALGPVAASKLGAPAGAFGFGAAALAGNVPGMVTSALSLANPVAGLVNAVSSMLGGPTVGKVAQGIGLSNETGLSFGEAYGINNMPKVDRLDGLVDAMNGWGTMGGGGNSSGGMGFGDRGPGGSSGESGASAGGATAGGPGGYGGGNSSGGMGFGTGSNGRGGGFGNGAGNSGNSGSGD
jgi:hypothetical protein